MKNKRYTNKIAAAIYKVSIINAVLWSILILIAFSFRDSLSSEYSMWESDLMTSVMIVSTLARILYLVIITVFLIGFAEIIQMLQNIMDDEFSSGGNGKNQLKSVDKPHVSDDEKISSVDENGESLQSEEKQQ